MDVTNYEQLLNGRGEIDKFKYIMSVTDNTIQLSLLRYLKSDEYKEKIINKFSSEALKVEALSNLELDSSKAEIVSTFTDVHFIEQALGYIKDEFKKIKVISQISNEDDRFNLIHFIKIEGYRAEVLVTITDDLLKIKGLSLLTKDQYKARIISTLSDDILKYELLNQIKDDSDKITIICSIKNEDILYNALLQLKLEYMKANVLIKISNDAMKYKFLSLIDTEYLKVNIIHSISNIDIKIKCIKLLTSDSSKIKTINQIDDEMIRVSLLSILEKEESKFLIISQMQSNEMKMIGLKTIDHYQIIMKKFFQNGSFEYLYHFDQNLLHEIFDDKQLNILKHYGRITNEKIRKLFSNYISTHYETINIENLDKISQILFKIEMSNSGELQAFGDLIASEVLAVEDPLQYFTKIEDIFVKNNIPYVGKIFKVFKLLHSNINDYKNASPLLNRFKYSKYSIQMMDLIIFNDLLKCAFGSNNRSLKDFINNIDQGNNILEHIMTHKILLGDLKEIEKDILMKYLDKVEIILENYEVWRSQKVTFEKTEGILLRMNYIMDELNIRGSNYKEIPDILVKNLCGIFGIDTLESAKKYFEYIILQTDKRNREKSNGPFILEQGDFVKGINHVKYLPRVLQNGSVSKEFLGDSSNSDATPLDTDVSRILAKDIDGKHQNELGKIIDSTLSSSYGSTWLVLKNDPSRIEITRDSSNIKKSSHGSSKFSKLEAFKTLQDGHYGIRTGFPSSEISYIISKNYFDRIGLEIAMNGFYIPVVNTNGELIFSPKEYDSLRNKMMGLSYYGCGKYEFADTLETVYTDFFLNEEIVEAGKKDVKMKQEKIFAAIERVLKKHNLYLKTQIDGDLTSGSAELINTGSTGRSTNIPLEGDYDYVMRLDKEIYFSNSKLEEIKKDLLQEFGQENGDIVKTGDFRLKKALVSGLSEPVEIDISFITKTDKIAYSTDMALQDRLQSIYKQDPMKYPLVIANILAAKKVLKEAEVYKSKRGDVPQGGLGGVGVENWILQNGGSFERAVRTFLEVAQSSESFEDFKHKYYIWDFGENHFSDRKNDYPHDNFVEDNMSQSGYRRMVDALNEYNKKHRLIQNETIKR